MPDDKSRRADSDAVPAAEARHELRALTSSLFASQENDRRLVARELHDDICQKLAVLEISARRALNGLSSQPEKALAELEGVCAGIAALSDDVRSLSHRLHPSVIDDLGLVPALRSLVEGFAEREGLIATFSVPEPPEETPADISIGLYRIAQEALRNVARHAGKTHVEVILRRVGGSLCLQVIDSGVGFDVRQRRSGLGFVSMEERARMMRGVLRVESEPGEGVRISVQVPCPPERS
jgi:signal transduction histidine kinase